MHDSMEAPAPLRILKKLNSVSTPEEQPENHHPRAEHAIETPPHRRSRSSSMTRRDNDDRHEVKQHTIDSQGSFHSESGSLHSLYSTSSSSAYSGQVPSRRSDRTSAPTSSSPHTIDCNHHLLSDTSSNILGNFIAIESPRSMANNAKGRILSDSNHALNQDEDFNAFGFGPVSPLFQDLHRQTTLSSFMDNPKMAALPLRQYHVKNARSDGNAYLSPRPTSLLVPNQTPRTRDLHRSESSPSINPGQFSESYQRSPSPDILTYYYGDLDSPVVTPQRGRQVSKPNLRGRANTMGEVQTPKTHIFSGSIDARPYHDHGYGERRPGSSSQSSHQAKKNSIESATTGKYKHASHSSRDYDGIEHKSIRSPPRVHHEVGGFDMNERMLESARQMSISPAEEVRITSEPKKRSRSPMKKMFGENGWLGRSPSEVNNLESPHKQEHTNKKPQPAKATMMSKIKNKFEGFAEKADFSASKNYLTGVNKSARPAILAVSLSPPEQARIYMELELMLVHTANGFLMTQFSQGRIAIDSIKKTFDNWKNKGRPSVIEFMYDQATQRDLVAVNQDTFRFHGERAGDGIRVNSMLYNWKQVASHMAIRTFCNADTVILKLLFDIGQILELLGAAEGILLRHQSIRLSVNDKVQAARLKEEKESAVLSERQMSWDKYHPNENFSRKHRSASSYGGNGTPSPAHTRGSATKSYQKF